MKKTKLLFALVTIGLVAFSINWAMSDSKLTERERRAKVIPWVDNNGYWKQMAEQGLAQLNPETTLQPAIYVGSKIKAFSVLTEDSPDVPVTTDPSRQSENSIITDINDGMTALNSNNSGPPSSGFYGANDQYTFDAGETFGGEIYGAGGSNSGDPAACIGTDGRWYVGFISGGGQGISYSDDKGENWTKVQVAPNPGQLADKNHLWLDNKIGSPYENYLYDVWTDFGGTYNNQIVVSTSSDNGETWSAKTVISQEVSAGNHNQGVNISTGPNGEVYAIWTIYDGWPADEKAIGFAKSMDGGETWEPSVRIIDNIRGIRNSEVPQNMRVNSFPVLACDISDGTNSGDLYAVWTNIGAPGENSGSDRRVYMIRSEDGGDTWSDPIQINQSENGNGFVSYFPWIACDPANGVLSTVFYDNRSSGTTLTETWCAVSSDGGDTWEDFKVSDVAFVPSPLPGMAYKYMGDYLGISAQDGWVYPCWTDTREGYMTYVSAFQTISVVAPTNLQAVVNQETGECDLTWSFEAGAGFEYFNIYRNDELINTTTDESYLDMLTEYGYYTYQVTAFYGGDNESTPSTDETQYGSATMLIDPNSLEANVYIGDSSIQYMYVKNTGELDLEFEMSPFFPNRNTLSYPAANGGGDEFIHRLTISNLDNSSAADHYADFTDMYASLRSGEKYPITIEIGNAYNGDQCAVWIDWNNNGEFDEVVTELIPDETSKYFKGNIRIPKGSKQGATRMRVRLAGPGEALAPVGDTKYGDVEDYTVIIEDWLTLTPDEGIVVPGDSLMIEVKFNAGKLEPGTYEDNVRFVTNDIESPFYNTYYTMNVTDLQVSASADPESICIGESTQLTAIPVGGTGSYTYSWSSMPEGFESTEKDPTDNPEEDTEYIVAVNDGIITLYDTVEVVVNALPVVDLGEDETFCGETEHELDAGNPGSEYLWSTGETTQTIIAGGEGETGFWVTVTNTGNCSSADTIYLNFAALPDVDLGPDTTICHNGEVGLDAGNPGSEYLWSTGETTQTITVYASDYEYGIEEFTCEVTTTDGCKDSDAVSIEIKDCTGIDEFSSSVSLEVYPNPNNGQFNLKIDSPNNQTLNVRVLSVSGVMVYSKEGIKVNGTFDQQIDLGEFAEGIYSVFVSGDEVLVNKKIIIRK